MRWIGRIAFAHRALVQKIYDRWQGGKGSKKRGFAFHFYFHFTPTSDAHVHASLPCCVCYYTHVPGLLCAQWLTGRKSGLLGGSLTLLHLWKAIAGCRCPQDCTQQKYDKKHSLWWWLLLLLVITLFRSHIGLLFVFQRDLTSIILEPSHQNKCVTREGRWILKSDILALKFLLFYLLAVLILGEIIFLNLTLQIYKMGIELMLHLREFLLENYIR